MSTFTQNVLLYLLDERVVFTGTRTFTKAIDYVWASDPDAKVNLTNLTNNTDGTSSFEIQKEYTSPVSLDSISIIIRFSDNTYQTVFYNVTVRDILFTTVDPQIVLIENANPRAVTFRFRVPPTTVSAVLVSSLFYTPPSIIPTPYPAPSLTVIPGYVICTQTFSTQGVNVIQADITLVDPIIGPITRRVLLPIRSVETNGLRIQGKSAVPFVISMCTKNPADEPSTIIATEFPNWYQSSSELHTVLNESNIGTLTNTIDLPRNYYYNFQTTEIADKLIERLNVFYGLRGKRSGEFFEFYLDNRSDYPLEFVLTKRLISDDNLLNVRNEIPSSKVFGFGSDSYTSKLNTIENVQSISAESPMMSIVPPMISFECVPFNNQHEGIIRQSESVRLYNFIMKKGQDDYLSFDAPITYPKRKLPNSYERYQSLAFRFIYNRQHEIMNAPVGDLPVEFVKPYYITLKIEFRATNKTNEIGSSLITITGTESIKIIQLDTPIDGISSIEIMEASLPKIVQPPIVPTRSVFMGYITDLSL